MSYKFENTVGAQLVGQLREALIEVIDVDNSLLPESYRAAKGFRSLASIEQEYERRQTVNGVSDHQAAKQSKAELIPIYAERASRGEPIFE